MHLLLIARTNFFQPTSQDAILAWVHRLPEFYLTTDDPRIAITFNGAQVIEGEDDNGQPVFGALWSVDLTVDESVLEQETPDEAFSKLTDGSVPIGLMQVLAPDWVAQYRQLLFDPDTLAICSGLSIALNAKGDFLTIDLDEIEDEAQSLGAHLMPLVG